MINPSKQTINEEVVHPLNDIGLIFEIYEVQYFRVSSDGQDEKMQIESVQAFCQQKKLLNTLEIHDTGVSAIKDDMDKRPGLSRLLSYIENGKVRSVIVYSRDRLARNVYEYAKILEYFYQYDVQVYFTAQNSVPFSKRSEIELLVAMFADYEGQLINDRTSDRNKMFPYQLLGYVTNKVEDKLTYTINDKYFNSLIDMFTECSAIETSEQFFNLLEKYAKKFKRKTDQIDRILHNPFYTGHYEKNKEYHRLPYVPPIIPLPLFQEVQKKVLRYKQDLIKAKSPRYLIIPVCHLCDDQMVLKNQSLNYSGDFICQNGHKKNMISVDDLNQKLKETMVEYIDSLSPQAIRETLLTEVNKLLKKYKTQEQHLIKKLEITNRKACIQRFKHNSNNGIKQVLKEQEIVKTELLETQEIYIQLEELKKQVNFVIEYLTTSLKDKILQDLLLLVKYLVDRVAVTEDALSIDLYLNEFTINHRKEGK